MTKYKYIIYLKGDQIMDSQLDDGTLFDDYDSAVDAALYSIGCYQLGDEILNLSNPGDYENNPNDKLDYEIEEVED